jgi:hypothetical protein
VAGTTTGRATWPAPLAISRVENLVPPVPSIPVPPVPPASPAALTELVTVGISLTDAAAAAVAVDVTDAIRADAAANIIEWIAASSAAGGVPRATLAVTAAPAGSIIPIPVPAPPAIAISLIAPAASPPAPLTVIGTALPIPATRIPCEATALDEGVLLLGEPEVRSRQRGQRHGGGHHLLQGHAPVLKCPEHASPIVETTLVHDASLLSSL